ncbi:MAG: hypothetical protein GY796_08585 [Chloroflexi bacterium]|nr:hypothetical protein [Chloroflexota bacterium]
MKETNPIRYAILRSAAAYGSGFAIGVLFILIFLNANVARTLTATMLGPLQIFLRLIFGIILILIIFGLGGGIAGMVGGYFAWIPYHEEAAADKKAQRRFMWRSGWGFFITQTILIVPLLVMTAVVGLLNPDLDVRLLKLPSLFFGYGLLYGAIVGLLIGWLTFGLRQTLGVWLSAIAGFSLGGILFGLGIQILSRMQQPGTLVVWITLLITVFLFGALGGGAMGYAFQNVHKQKRIFPESRGWRILRNVSLVIIFIIFLSAAGKLISTLTIRPASLEPVLSLPTQGTHWLPTEQTLAPVGDVGDGRNLQATCTENGAITVVVDGLTIDPLMTLPCYTDPALAADSEGDLHLIWYSDQVVKVTGTPGSGHFLYEQILTPNGWTEPTIVAQPTDVTVPKLTAVSADILSLTWADTAGEHQLAYQPYNCDGVPLTPIGEAVYTAVRQEKFRPTSDPIPYCNNTYRQLLYTPNPSAPDSSEPQNPDGAFDEVADLARTAEYEFLFVTMQWDAPAKEGSPGLTLTTAIADLYEKVKTNPENYPRGMTVRILLGNLPDLAVFDPTTQIYHVMYDLRTAGVTKLVDEEIGWKLEIADFDGAWPHAHSKFIVIDGKVSAAAGFNYSYLHLPKEHPSGQGLDMSDKGLQVIGPVAQTVLAAHDDLWSGSDLYDCPRFPPPIPYLDFLWCDIRTAEATHPPEVLRFYPTDGNANAFALHHTSAHLEADEAILAAIHSAAETIDLQQVNFSLETVCVAAIVLAGLCDEEGLAPPYMNELVTAVVENDVKVRAIVEPSAFNGFENRMGIQWIMKQLELYGKQDNLEIRFSDNKMHDKAVLIDGQLLIVGSQNFHWSAWDTPSLTEYNIATEDLEAITNFQNEYNYQWSIATPAEELMRP